MSLPFPKVGEGWAAVKYCPDGRSCHMQIMSEDQKSPEERRTTRKRRRAGDAEAGAGSQRPPSHRPKEIGGPKGPEPTRYGDWEQNGRCTDF